MKIELIQEALNGLKVFKPEVFEDERGFFTEVYRTDQFEKAGVKETFVQDNHSRSAYGVLRGLHFQWDPPMAKLMRVTLGEAFLVAVDIRKNSPTLGQWYGEMVSDKNRKMVFAPAGFARGFCVCSEFAEIQYKCSGLYNKECEAGILWNDPAIGIEWPIIPTNLSAKDLTAPTLETWLEDMRFNNFIYLK
jgi:dTDP-4-dehydrorhamnose 3,5-epimerase